MKITSEFCRICLTNSSLFNEETNSFESFSIYKKDENNQSFADKLEHLTKLKIPRNVPLAKRICKECCVKLNSSYNLIKQCEENERIIQNYQEENSLYQHNDSNKTSSNLKVTRYQDQFQKAIKHDTEVKEQIKIEPVIFQDDSFLFTSDNHNENSDENDFQTVQNDEFESDQDINEKKPLTEIGSQFKKINCDSDYGENDDDSDTDFTVDDVVDNLSSNDESDSDYAPRPKKTNNKMVSLIKLKKNVQSKANQRCRVIKLNLIRGKKLKNDTDHVEAESIGDNLSKEIENDEKNEDQLSKLKNSVSLNNLRSRHLIKLIPMSRKLLNLKGRKKIYLKPKQSNFGYSKATVCPICGKMYQSGDTMRGHIKWHENNEEYFKCDVCGKGFENPSYLRSHKRIHSKRPTPYTCEVCGKAFFHPNKLRLHIQYSHTEERLKCPHCDVSVKYPSSLKRHLFTHNDIKNFECIDCSKTFRSRSNLIQHLESKFHSTKEIQPMIRIKGIAEQYVAGPPKPSSYTKKRKSQIKKENFSQELQMPQDQSIESVEIESTHSTYENYDNGADTTGNFLNKFAQFSSTKIE